VTANPEVSKSQVAYRWIRERIASGTFGPGYRLVLSAIATELGMSVVPVREAVRALTSEGLVALERHVGARVAAVDGSQYRFAMQAIGIVESAATALAAPFLTPADLARARELNDVVRRGLPDLDPRVFRAVNQELHRTLYACCPNPRLLEMVRAEWLRLGHLRDSVAEIVPGRSAAVVAEHDALLDLIAGGAAPEAIEAAVRSHRSGSLTADLAGRHPETDLCDLPLPGPFSGPLAEGA
jgi:DNA-binding GntR family transcriptional regulator